MTDPKRYIVIKRSDFVTDRDEKVLRGWMDKFCVKPIEADWPMHEARDLLERIDRAFTDPAPASDGGTTPERLEELLEEAVPILRAVAGQQGESA